MIPKVKRSKKTIYLDHAATTYLDSRVLKAMKPFWQDKYGNPSSLYQKGRQGSEAVEFSRKIVADAIGARPSEIVFTAGGTESANLAIFGAARKYRPDSGQPYHLLASVVEHHAVLHPFEALNRLGYLAQTVSVSKQGIIDFEQLKAAVTPQTILISVMLANNEVGSIQPVAKIGDWLRKENQKRKQKNLPHILLHTDACQAAGVLDLNVQKLGVDLMTVNGSKIYGPKQTGFLFVRSGVNLEPLIYGGGQEQGLRSGTENVPGIVGFAQAFKLAKKIRQKENVRLIRLRDYFIKQVQNRIPKAILNGAAGEYRLPNNISFTFPGVEGEALMLYLDSYNVCVATGSACMAQSPDPSHVLLALGLTDEAARSSIRFTLGRQTTKQDLDYVLKILPGLVEELSKV